MFDEDSRYRDLEPYLVTDRRGRSVHVVPSPPCPQQMFLGYHLRRQGQRLDHLAAHYLDQPSGFWRICELNDVMLAETLSEAPEIAIPRKSR